MAFTDEEIKDSYLQDITKPCPIRKVRGVWQNTVIKRGRLSDEMVNHLDQKKGK